MHGCSAKRGIAIVSRPPVCPFVCLSVTLRYRGHIGWTRSKLIICILYNYLMVFAPRSPKVDNVVQGEHPQNSGGIGVKSHFTAENLQYLCNGAR